ncbi:prothoracicostatic peptide isoform X2 [Planococcus citri]|uniref:prothoracicostatic peptide isoform X2 n=1 Tax=Planococcus citri TaxID=170843 RepID=UPI0031F8D62E
MIRVLDGGVLLWLASCVLVIKSESTQNGRAVHSNAETRQQLQDADVAVALSPANANNLLELMESANANANAKRAWKDLPGSGWGKRSWQDLQSSGWGKRGWQDLQTSGWGKRGWQDLQTSGWGKRAWQNLPSSGWGKRAPRAYQNFATLRSRNGFDNNEKLMADEMGDVDGAGAGAGADAMTIEDDDAIDAVKKAWDNLRGPWGKRDASDWGSMKGAWGKRDPAWHNLKGLWGKRSSSSLTAAADNFYDINSQDLQGNL